MTSVARMTSPHTGTRLRAHAHDRTSRHGIHHPRGHHGAARQHKGHA